MVSSTRDVVKKFIIIFLLLISTNVFAFDKWSDKDINLQRVDTVLHIADWLQTREIATNDDYYETNKILGKYPSMSEVNLYFFSTLLLKIGITHILPSEYRTYWQAGTIGCSLYYTTHNYGLGIRIKL